MRGTELVTALGLCALTLVPACSTTAGSPAPAPVPVPNGAPTSKQSATDKLGEQVMQSMQEKFDTDADLSTLKLRVTNVVLVNSSGNQYKGIATVRTQKGTEHDVTVNVTADGNNMMWETEPGAFLFALQERDDPPRATHPATAPPPQVEAVPGADTAGFLGGPRCVNRAALIIRTALSGVVVCNDSAGTYLYQGLRLKDGGRIVLPATPTATGFQAINPTDGTRYDASPDGLDIYTDGEHYSEQAIAAGP